MQTLFLRKGLSGHTMAVIFIHDLIPTVLSAVLPDTSSFFVIDANRKSACCQGRFRCWLASPGQCVMKDDLQTVGVQIGTCKKVIILSRCYYGGFSPGVKRCWIVPYRSVFRFSPIAAGVSTIRCAIKIAPRLQFASMVPLRTLSVKRP